MRLAEVIGRCQRRGDRELLKRLEVVHAELQQGERQRRLGRVDVARARGRRDDGTGDPGERGVEAGVVAAEAVAADRAEPARGGELGVLEGVRAGERLIVKNPDGEQVGGGGLGAVRDVFGEGRRRAAGDAVGPISTQPDSAQRNTSNWAASVGAARSG